MDQDGFLYYVEGFRDDMEDYVEEMDSRQGLSLSTPEDVLKYVEEYGVSSIRLWFTDMLGFLKSFSITPKELEGAFEEGMGFDGSSIEGYQRIQESDMVAVPIASTAQVLPFGRVAPGHPDVRGDPEPGWDPLCVPSPGWSFSGNWPG